MAFPSIQKMSVLKVTKASPVTAKKGIVSRQDRIKWCLICRLLLSRQGMALAINVMHGHDPSNEMRSQLQPKKNKIRPRDNVDDESSFALYEAIFIHPVVPQALLQLIIA